MTPGGRGLSESKKRKARGGARELVRGMETSSARGGARIISERARKKLATRATGRARGNFPVAYAAAARAAPTSLPHYPSGFRW